MYISSERYVHEAVQILNLSSAKTICYFDWRCTLFCGFWTHAMLNVTLSYFW